MQMKRKCLQIRVCCVWLSFILKYIDKNYNYHQLIYVPAERLKCSINGTRPSCKIQFKSNMNMQKYNLSTSSCLISTNISTFKAEGYFPNLLYLILANMWQTKQSVRLPLDYLVVARWLSSVCLWCKTKVQHIGYRLAAIGVWYDYSSNCWTHAIFQLTEHHTNGRIVMIDIWNVIAATHFSIKVLLWLSLYGWLWYHFISRYDEINNAGYFLAWAPGDIICFCFPIMIVHAKLKLPTEVQRQYMEYTMWLDVPGGTTCCHSLQSWSV